MEMNKEEIIKKLSKCDEDKEFYNLFSKHDLIHLIKNQNEKLIYCISCGVKITNDNLGKKIDNNAQCYKCNEKLKLAFKEKYKKYIKK